MSAAKIENGIYKYSVSYIKQLYVIKFVNDLHQVSGFLRVVWYLRLRVDCTLFCNLQSRARTYAVLVIGLYELLGNPTI
jgi:hypothetical protein